MTKKKRNWGVFEMSGGDIHVAPCWDVQGHDLTRECDCKPTLEVIDGKNVLTHNSWDFREVKEAMRDGTLLEEIKS